MQRIYSTMPEPCSSLAVKKRMRLDFILILISDLKEYKNQVKSFNLWVFTRIFILNSTLFEEISITYEALLNVKKHLCIYYHALPIMSSLNVIVTRRFYF